jgi:hypothetical protein
MRAGRQRPTWRRTQLRLHRIAHRRDVIRPESAESNWFDAVDSSRMDHRAVGSGGARRDGSPADNMGVNLFVAQKRLPALERGYARWSYVIVHTALSPG